MDDDRGSCVLAGWTNNGSALMRSGQHRAILSVGIAVVVVASATAVYLVRDRLFTGPVSEQSIQPEFITPIGSDGSLVNVDVGFPWSEQGYCAGQFQVSASETSIEVSVGSVNESLYGQDPAQKLQVVLEIAQHLARTLDLEELLAKLLDQLIRLFPHADRAMVLLFEGDRLVPGGVARGQDPG